MKSKAKEYAIKEYKRLGNDVYVSEKNLCFSIIDIKAAYNAGRKSVVESIPKLKWVECVGGYVAETNFNEWYIEVNELVKEKYTLVIANATPRCFTTLKNAKQAANEDYKKRIIQALGL